MKHIILILFIVVLSMATRETDLVTETLPGCSQGNFKQYSGYFNIDEVKKFHYIFVESARDPATDPVVFWFEGGPGCSSMNGYIAEHGPCAFIDDADFMPQDNPYSWNKFANVVYIESPVGTGYNNHPELLPYNDEIVSHDNMKATLEFFRMYPEFKSNEFYLSGVSYGGIYVPYLALRIDEYNQEAEEKINLKGFLIGNGVTNWKFDGFTAYMEVAFTNGIITNEFHEKLQNSGCDFAEFGRENPGREQECDGLYQEFYEKVKIANLYDVYRPVDEYYEYPDEGKTLKLLLSDEKPTCPYNLLSGFNNGKCFKSSNEIIPQKRYLNRADVKSILHIPASYTWELCSPVDYSWGIKASEWIYPKFKGKYRMMHYSGTTDGRIPTIGTQRWMEHLGWPITKERQPWFLEPHLLGGFTQSREGGLDLITVHGVGHMVAQWGKSQMFMIASSWIFGKDLPRQE
ncbi:unnamed protein product [Moneuplotes crassus]|uniref:Carboxypeptidase n=1 Tax=Euplotes crassus TaxID=5936 RepID=A0AAD1UFP4_EUPCR|nr:unnamed protein product [Moneuplotes crassus]